MYTVKDVAELTRLSSRQVYDRIAALSPVLDGTLRTGSRGAKLLTQQGFAIFQRLVELEQQGISRESAVNVIDEELHTPQQNSAEVTRNEWEGVGNLVATLQRVIEDQREEITFLRHQVETLTPLALPRPRRWVTLFRRREG